MIAALIYNKTDSSLQSKRVIAFLLLFLERVSPLDDSLVKYRYLSALLEAPYNSVWYLVGNFNIIGQLEIQSSAFENVESDFDEMSGERFFWEPIP